jgi:ribosome-binding protein aMBF1 (putative translation factor)
VALFSGKNKTVATRLLGKSMIICDLCGKATDCLQKEIEGKEYDICSECWNPFAQKLRGKGRAINREIVLLPPPRAVKEQEDEERPGEPPKIWGAVQHP